MIELIAFIFFLVILVKLFSYPFIFIPIAIFIALIVNAIMVSRAKRREKQKLLESGILDIDNMSGKEFERYLEVLFEKLGYRVVRTKYAGDYGADLIIQGDGAKIAVQAKRLNGKVGVRAVQEVIGARGYYDCDEAMIITNSYFTKQAEELAFKNRVILWNRNKLVEVLLEIKKAEMEKTEKKG